MKIEWSIIKELALRENPNLADVFKRRSITLDNFLDAISKPTYNLATELKCSATTSTNISRAAFPNKPKNVKINTYLLRENNLGYCAMCNSIKEENEFYKNNTKSSGLGQCKSCMSDYQREYYPENSEKWINCSHKGREAIKRATPKWAELEKIKLFYKNRIDGQHIDHIIPLRGENVCGLHVLANLRYMTAVDNMSKSNKFDESMLDEEYIPTVVELNPPTNKIVKKSCPTCGKLLENKNTTGYCIKHRPVLKEIDVKDIEYWVSNFSWTRAAKELGMSDNGLRKRYKNITGLDPKSILKVKI